MKLSLEQVAMDTHRPHFLKAHRRPDHKSVARRAGSPNRRFRRLLRVLEDRREARCGRRRRRERRKRCESDRRFVLRRLLIHERGQSLRELRATALCLELTLRPLLQTGEDEANLGRTRATLQAHVRRDEPPFVIGEPERDAWLKHMGDAVKFLELAPEQEQQLWNYLVYAAHSLVNA